jgi:hypothetical protein
MYWEIYKIKGQHMKIPAAKPDVPPTKYNVQNSYPFYQDEQHIIPLKTPNDSITH